MSSMSWGMHMLWGNRQFFWPIVKNEKDYLSISAGIGLYSILTPLVVRKKSRELFESILKTSARVQRAERPSGIYDHLILVLYLYSQRLLAIDAGEKV